MPRAGRAMSASCVMTATAASSGASSAWRERFPPRFLLPIHVHPRSPERRSCRRSASSNSDIASRYMRCPSWSSGSFLSHPASFPLSVSSATCVLAVSTRCASAGSIEWRNSDPSARACSMTNRTSLSPGHASITSSANCRKTQFGLNQSDPSVKQMITIRIRSE